MTSTATTDSLLDLLGGCGLFQVLIVITTHSPNIVAGWTLLFMAFGNYNPGWACEDRGTSNFSSSILVDSTAISNNSRGNASSCSVHESCQNVVYNSDSSTIVTEWNLACDKSWIVSTILSLEMLGALFGALPFGQLNEYFGRKACHFGVLLMHAIVNFVAMFSVNWSMYAAMRFLLGMTSASLYISTFLYPVEFLTTRWRGPFTGLPTTNFGFLMFATLAMYLRDWKKLHLCTSILSFVCIVPVLWVPRSLRWLTVKGKTDKAHRVVMKIAKVNRTQVPNIDIIDTIAKREIGLKKRAPVKTVLDLYRHGFLYRTIVIAYTWFAFEFIFAIIMFGIKNLSGNFYINLMIFSVITTISYPFVSVFSNTVGRKWGIFIFLILSLICCAGLIGKSLDKDSRDTGLVRTILSFGLICGIDGAWAVVVVYTTELYPTPLRSLACSHPSSIARAGGMIAPFLIGDGETSVWTYVIMAAMTSVAVVCYCFLPETKGKPMPDVIDRSCTLSGVSRHADVEEKETEVM